MALRKGKSNRPDTLVRSMDAGTLPSEPMRAMLLDERQAMIGLMNAIAKDLHVEDPLTIPDGHDKAAVARHVGKGLGWKFAYAQRLGEAAEDAVKNVRKQYLGRLRGALFHCDAALEQPSKDEPTRKLQYVPAAIRDQVTSADFAALKALASTSAWMAAARAVAQGEHPARLTPIQSAIVAECRRFALSRYKQPAFNELGPNASDTFTVQLRLEERMFVGFMNKGRELFAKLNADMQAAFAAQQPSFTWPLALTGLHGKDSFTVPVTITQAVWDAVRREQNAEVSGLSLEIGPDTVRVRATLRLLRRTPDVDRFSRTKRHTLTEDDFQALADAVNARPNLLARDVNLVNTLAHAIVRRDCTITPERLKQATFLSKDQARDYLQSHCHDGANVVHTQHFSGRRFLDHVAALAGFIDTLRGKIDRGYAKLRELKRCLVKPMGLNSPEDHIPVDAVHDDPFVQHLLHRFHRLLGRIRKLKALRVEQYERIAAVKACWFGWVTNREVELAVAHDAAVVREDAGFVTIPKDDPKYRGRAFNRLMNNGSRGRIERLASAKLAWRGIPEVRIPSYYTSTTDTRFGVVEGGQRRGDVFVAAKDGRCWHSDEHAGVTIGEWLLLRAA